jgi:FAD/FMN-containing dehydrogenase
MLHARDAPAYEALRQNAVWNAIVPSRRPDAIGAPRSAEEVAQLVREARADGRRIAAKSGGHNWRGACLRDEGVLIDFAGLARVEVDADRMLARAEPGATHQLLADAIAPEGLGFPIGHCETVGLGGYLLAGGYGWNPRTWGPGCWNVTGLDVVTVDGRQLHIDAEHEPELFWAARGGAAGFPAFVTSFDLRLHPLPKIATRRAHYPLARLPELLDWSSKLEQADPGLEIALIAHRPEGRSEPCTTVQATGFANTHEGAEALLADAFSDMPGSGEPLAPAETVPVELNRLETEAAWVHGRRYSVDMCWVADSYEDVGEICRAAIDAAASPLTRIVLAWVFPPLDREAPDVAQTMNGTLTVNLYAIWEHPADDGANERWTASTMSALEPHVSGFYAGEADLAVDDDRKVRSYPPEKWERLARVRDAYDPGGVKFGFITDD